MAEPLQPAAESAGSLLHEFGAQVGHLAALDVVPHAFGRVEVGCVGGQPFHLYPIVLAPEERAHLVAPMRRQTVPDQDHGLSAYETLELPEKVDQTGRVVAAWFGTGEQSRLVAVPPET